jgi:rifampicin phosphotransferase
MQLASPRTGRTLDAGPNSLILPLHQIDPGAASLVGRKAFRLGRLIHAGYRVPSGFCLTARAIPPGDQAGLSEAEAEAILAAWRASGFRVAAVRSSATEEDDDDASWAGVFPTVLPVKDEDGLLAAIELCLRALHCSDAARYRAASAGRRHAPGMAVLVHELVEADAAGILFTANPVTGSADEMVVNVVPGLGEPLAAGRVTGDSFVLDRDGRIKTAILSTKNAMLTADGEVSLGADRRDRPTLTQPQLGRLSQLAAGVERIFGCPQDIEFAVRGDEIHFLQARPITGAVLRDSPEAIDAYVASERDRLRARLAELRRSGRLAGRDAILSNGNIGELLPTPTPMSFALFQEIFTSNGGAVVRGRRRLGYQLADDAAVALLELVCGQPRFNLEIDAGTFDIGLPLEIDELLKETTADPSRANYPEFGLYRQYLSWEEAKERFGHMEGGRRHIHMRRFRRVMIDNARAILAEFSLKEEPALRRNLKACRSLIAAADATPTGELINAFRAAAGRLKRDSCAVFVAVARLGFYFADLVRSRMERLLGDGALATPLLQGLKGSRITEQALDLGRLAEGRINQAEFLQAYGHMALNELELTSPRLAETPEALDRLLANLTRCGRRPSEDFNQLHQARLDAEADLRRRLARAAPNGDEAAELFVDLELAQALLPLRETVKYYFAAEYAVIRAVLKTLNRRLEWAEDDIFHLRPDEIESAFAHRAKMSEIVARRRRERRLAKTLESQRRIPAVIFASRLEAVGAWPEAPGFCGLSGVPVAPGVAIGKVRLLDDRSFEAGCADLRGDEIIVARSASLGLAPAFRVASGLVLEVGGVLAHAACQARESGIPAVVLANATAILRDGMTIRIDGSAGSIEPLDGA